MRLNHTLRKYATEELLAILGSRPEEWVATKDLVGTPRFHGTRTLGSRQVNDLLRVSGRAEEQAYAYGPYTQIVWRTKPEATAIDSLASRTGKRKREGRTLKARLNC